MFFFYISERRNWCSSSYWRRKKNFDLRRIPRSPKITTYQIRRKIIKENSSKNQKQGTFVCCISLEHQSWKSLFFQISAQESRRKKKEYMDCLEKRMSVLADELEAYKKRYNHLEGQNINLRSQVQQMQAQLSNCSCKK